MDYQEFIDAGRRLDFIPGDQTGDALVKAVLGILARGLTHSMAQNLASFLPDLLDYDRLQGHQGRPAAVDSRQYVKKTAGILPLFELDKEGGKEEGGGRSDHDLCPGLRPKQIAQGILPVFEDHGNLQRHACGKTLANPVNRGDFFRFLQDSGVSRMWASGKEGDRKDFSSGA